MSNEDVLRARPSPWPYVIVGTFLLLAVANVFILYLALSTKVAPLDDQPYEAGLQYETTIVERQAALSDGVSAKFEPSESGIMAHIAGLSENPHWNAEIQLIRPNDSSLDQSAAATGPGPVFEFPLRFRQGGLWLVRLRLKAGSKTYYFEDKFMRSSL